jgi:hypothetical protein
LKHAFLVAHDYGTGGIWAYIRANSADEIHAKFRDLKVLDEPPGWMTEAKRQDIETRSSFDVETVEAQHPTFASLLRES